MQKGYLYPDTGDGITASFITTKEPYRGYWEKSEKHLLNMMTKVMQRHTVGSADAWLLDAGCGTGRLLPGFEKYFNHILAIDPDPTQIEKAQRNVSELGFDNKVVFQATPIEKLSWKEESIDAILCSHILQHMNTATVHLAMQRFRSFLKERGLLFITTTHSRRDSDYYVKAYLKHSNVVEKEVEKEEFNALVSNGKGILPIHFFSMRSITGELEESGFVVRDIRSYHVLGKVPIVDRLVDRDSLINSTILLKKRFGRDMFVFAQKIGG